MSSRRYLIALSACSLLLAGAHSYAEPASDALKTLKEQADFWQQKQDLQRATQAWERLLQAHPNDVDALYWLGVNAAQKKDNASAQRYLQKLSAAPDGKAKAAQLQQQINLAGQGSGNLEQARQLAKAGQFDEAVHRMRPLFAGAEPQGALGVEFYEYLGFTPSGGAEARAGLERITSAQPNQATWALAYAKLLVRNPQTRNQGINRLISLAEHPEVGAQASSAWREALIWSGTPDRQSLPLFEKYLAKNANDAAIAASIQKYRAHSAAAARPVKVQASPLAQAFSALENNQLDMAERLFQERLTKAPQDRDALGGLGVIRQKQNRLEEAQSLLDKAVQGRPQSQWAAAHNEVRFWNLFNQATDLRANSRVLDAQTRIDQALRLKPNSVEGRQLKADLLVAQNRHSDAERIYRQLLAEKANSVPARVGLVTTLTARGEQDEALRQIELLPESEREKIGGLGSLRAETALQRAKQAQQRGDTEAQRSALEEALRHDPNSTWARFELARLYQSSGASGEAQSLLDGLLKTRPNDPEVIYANALLAVENSNWPQAYTLLSQIPPNVRTAQINELLQEVDFQGRMADVDALAKSGRNDEAKVLLGRIEPLAATSLERQARVAQAYASIKETDRAIMLMRDLLARSPRQDDSMTISYASVLLEAGQDVEVAAILRDLQKRPLGAYDRTRYEDLVFGYRIRQAEALREQGNLVGAYDTLAPALAIRPQDPAAIGALARMYSANAQPDKALELYRGAVQRNPNDSKLIVSAAELATQLNHHGEAEQYLERALQLAPTNVEVMTAAANTYRAQGKTAKASKMLERVVAYEQRLARPDSAGQSSLTANPFAGDPRSAMAVIPEPASVSNHPFLHPFSYDGATPATSSNSANPFAGLGPNGQPDPYAGMTPAARALSEIRQERSAYVTQGVNVRSNDNDSGVGKITDIQAPLEINFPAGESRLAVRITPVSLNGGEPTGEGRTRYGSGILNTELDELANFKVPAPEDLEEPLTPPMRDRWIKAQNQAHQTQSPGRQSASGVGASIAWQHEPTGLKADVGVSPNGFMYDEVVGGIGIERPFSGSSSLTYGAELARRMVTDSVTSFAGTKDKRSGLEWGGVTATGGTGKINFDDGKVGAYAQLGVHHIEGTNVEDNLKVEVGGGFYKYLVNDKDERLTVGLALTAMGFENNQNHFNYGSGGYFSPKNFFSLSVPISWEKRSDRWSYAVRGALGVQHNEQDSSPYFMTNKAMQQRLEEIAAAAAEQDWYIRTHTEQTSDTGIGYNLYGAAEYKFGSNMIFGGQLGVNNAPDYMQWNGGMYLRYMLEPQRTLPMSLPVRPNGSTY